MLCIGLDVHKKKTTVAGLNRETGEVMRVRKVATTEVVEYVTGLPQPLRVALEDGSGSGFLARQLISFGIDAIVVDSFKLSRLIEALNSAKTDRLDARTIASLLAQGVLDDIATWVPDEDTAKLRGLCRARDQRVEETVRLRNLIRKLLTHHQLTCPYTDLCGAAASVWLDEIAAELDPQVAFVLASHRRMLAAVTAEARALADRTAELTADNPQVELLRTIPGCGSIIGPIIAAQIGDISRFDSAAKLCSYAGLAPRVSQSGERCHTGPLPKSGNPYLRRALILLAQHFATRKDFRHLLPMKQYWRVVLKHGPNPAKVALARRLLAIIFAMLRDNKPFDLERLAS